MRNYLIILLFALVPAFAFSQQNVKESLHQKLATALNDSVRMDVSNSLGIYFGELNRDSSLWYREKALSYARHLRLKIDEADILIGIGYINLEMKNYPGCFRVLLQALKILEDPANNTNPYILSDGQSAQVSRFSTLAVNYFVLADLYRITGNPGKSLVYNAKAMSLAESERDTVLLAYTHAFNGRAYLEMGKPDTALILETKALGFFSSIAKTGDNKYLASVLNIISRILLLQKKYSTSIETLDRAIQIGIEKNNFSAVAECYLTRAELYQETRLPDSSIYFAHKSLQLFSQLGNAEGRSNALSRLSSVFYTKHMPDSAYHYINLASHLKDSLSLAEKRNLDAYQNIGFNEQFRIQELESEKIQTRNRTRTWFLLGSTGVLLLLTLIFYRNIIQKQKAKRKIEQTYEELKAAQQHLIQSEKMASLGELTAGIAHEIQNPLNFVNNFSEVSNELIDEMNEELEKGDIEEAKALAADVKQNLEKINHHGHRAADIVKGMLQHSRSSTGQKELTDINALCEEYLRLAYHGLRAKDKSFNAKFETDFDASLSKINIIPQDIGRVILNLINNAFYAVSDKKKIAKENYEPTVIVSTKKENGNVIISVKDNGNGIPETIKDKIFQPFFTTKPTGQGTGLGLSLSYDIVKAHGGEVKVKTKESEGTEFIIQIPIS